jgi:hypothetical protein
MAKRKSTKGQTTIYSFPHSRLITGFVTRLTRRVPLVEQELLTLPEHMSSPPVLVGFVLNFTQNGQVDSEKTQQI